MTKTPYARWFLALLLASLVFRFLYAGWVQLSGDELMHWQWSRHLAFGYPEHPPLIAWTMALETRLFGTTERAIRLVSVLAMTGVLGLAFRLGSELYGARAAFYGSTALLMTPIVCAGGVIATTDALHAFFWTLTVYGVKKAALDGRRLAWLAAGAAAGCALLTKLPAVFLFPATAIVLLGTKSGRAWIKRREPYAAAALALLIFSPNVIWNSRHGWVTLLMRVGYGVPEHFSLQHLGELLATQLFTVTPVLFVGLVWALWQCWRRRADERAVFLGAYMAAPFLFYFGYTLHASVDVHWPAVSYITGAVAAAAFVTEAASRRLAPVLLTSAAVPAFLLVGALYVIPLDPDLVHFTWTYSNSNRLTTDRLQDVVDWRQLGDPIGRLLAENPGPGFLLCRNGYAVAGLVSFYAPGQPPVFLWETAGRNGAAYNSWKEETDLHGWNAVIVDDLQEPGYFDDARGAFESVSAKTRVPLMRHGRVIREFDVAFGKGFKGFPVEK